VKILIQIQLTDSYGPFLNGPASPRRGSPQLLIPRPHDFWKDFHVKVFSKNEPLEPSTSGGEADYRCGRYGPCSLIGATLEWEFPVESFTSDSVTIQVTPPEGDQVSVDFDLVSFR
jgi:hypothetical protein